MQPTITEENTLSLKEWVFLWLIAFTTTAIVIVGVLIINKVLQAWSIT